MARLLKELLDSPRPQHTYAHFCSRHDWEILLRGAPTGLRFSNASCGAQTVTFRGSRAIGVEHQDDPPVYTMRDAVTGKTYDYTQCVMIQKMAAGSVSYAEWVARERGLTNGEKTDK